MNATIDKIYKEAKQKWWLILVVGFSLTLLFFLVRYALKKIIIMKKKLILTDYIKENKEAFIEEVKSISYDLGIDPNWLMAVMAIETGYTFSPKAKNPKSTATGLIQFLQATAIELDTTTLALSQMTNVQQLAYVKKYFEKRIKEHGKLKSFADVYAAVFYPAFIGKPGNTQLPANAYAANKGIDINKDGIITKDDFNQWALKSFTPNERNVLSA